MKQLTPFIVLLLTVLLAACGSSEAPRPATGGSGSETRWIAGTPVVTQGEGFMLLHHVTEGPDGPWTSETATFVSLGEHTLAPGQVHRVSVEMQENEGVADAPSREWRVTAVHESRPGGPPVDVAPGLGAGGLTLGDAGTELREMGPFTLEASPPSISFSVDEVGAVRVGEHTYRVGEPLEAFIDALGGCETQANRGATVYTCDGLRVVQGGPAPDHNVRITVVARGEAPPAGRCAADSCDACLALPGCNWTGGQCSPQCLMDTSCFGPGNPSAASCPTE